LSYALARALVKVEHIGLVNLVAGERLMPEFIQQQATPAALASALSPHLGDAADRKRAVAGLQRVRSALAAPGQDTRPAAERVVDLVAELLSSASGRSGAGDA
jgi:lipid-A-disaccharide synthase